MATVTRDTRQTVVMAAAELFRKQGYAGTSMQQVAAATGISKGNLTYHFPSKQELLAEVLRQGSWYVLDHLLSRSLKEAGDVLDGLELFTRRLRRVLVDEDGHFVGCVFTNIAVETQHGEPALAELARSPFSRFKEILTAAFATGQLAGRIRADIPAASLAQAFFWMYEGALAVARAADDAAEYDAFRARLRELLAPAA